MNTALISWINVVEILERWPQRVILLCLVHHEYMRESSAQSKRLVLAPIPVRRFHGDGEGNSGIQKRYIV